MSTINKILVAMVFFAFGYMTAIVVLWPVDPKEKLLEDYNFIHIFEDGSWRAENHNNVIIGGCIPGAQCND